MRPRGTGLKTGHVTFFALATEPKFAAGNANRASLLKGVMLVKGALTFQYERKKK